MSFLSVANKNPKEYDIWGEESCEEQIIITQNFRHFCGILDHSELV